MKRMKRRVTADLYDFLAFPAAGDFAAGPFRTSVKSFLTKHALLPPPASLLPHLLTWQIWFRVGETVFDGGESSPAAVCLDVVEEDVARSRSVYCDQCRVVGEFLSHHHRVQLAFFFPLFFSINLSWYFVCFREILKYFHQPGCENGKYIAMAPNQC